MKSILFPLVFLGMFGCMMAKNNTPMVEHQIVHYSIGTPDGYVIRDVTPPNMDFILQEISKIGNHSCVLVLYIGNAPSFPKLQWSSAKKEVVSSSSKHIFYTSADGVSQIEGLFEFKGLKYRNMPFTPFSMIHYFTDGKPDPDDLKAFKAVIDSVHVIDQHP